MTKTLWRVDVVRPDDTPELDSVYGYLALAARRLEQLHRAGKPAVIREL